MTNRDQRVLLSIILFIYSLIGLVLIWKFKGQVFYSEVKGAPQDMWRTLWAIPWAFFGLGLRAFAMRNWEGPPWKAYLRYLVSIFVGCFCIFIVFHSAVTVSNWTYYPVMSLASFILGYDPNI